MAEYKTKLQSNVSWLETFKMGRKAPAVANRIFNTLADAQLYVDDLNDSATEGIRITILQDWNYVTDSNGNGYGEDGYVETREDGPYSGLYYVKSIGDGKEPGVLVKLTRGNAAWFRGNGVTEDGSKFVVKGATVGDIYMNSATLDTYVLQDDDSWKKVGNIEAKKINQEAAYYKLSTNGLKHPEFSLDTWTMGNENGDNIPCDYEAYNASQVYLWTRFYDKENGEMHAKYTVSLVYSSLELGKFELQ